MLVGLSTVQNLTETALSYTSKHHLCHTSPDPEPPTVPALFSPAARVPILSSPILFPLLLLFGSFWFLACGAISGWPSVPLILPAHCVPSWAGS